MSKSIQERVRATLAKQERDAKAAAYKAGESARRSMSARFAAAVRAENRLDGIIDGSITPRNAKEAEIQYRAMYDDLE